MKVLVKALTMFSLLFSVQVFANEAIDALNVEVIKQTMTAEQIQSSLDHWKEMTLANEQIDVLSNYLPLDMRLAMAREQVEQEYNQALHLLDL